MQIILPVGYNKEFPVMKKPQAFLPLANREIFQMTLNKLKNYEVIVVTPFPKYFKHYEVQVVKDEEGGSAAALKAAEKIINTTFLVHFTDIFTPFRVEPLLNFHNQVKPVATMLITQSTSPWRYSTVSTDPIGRVVRYLYRPRPDLVFSNKVDAGIYVFEPYILDKIPHKMQTHELITYLLHRGDPVYAYESKAFWYHIGSVSEYVEANRDYLQRRMELTQEDVSGVNAYPPVSLINVHARLAMVGPYVSARDCELGRNVKVTNSIILEGAQIGDNVTISDSVIGPNCIIEDNAVITESLIGEGSRVGKNAKVGRSVVGIEKEVMENVFEALLF